jgi:hypothetical protein
LTLFRSGSSFSQLVIPHVKDDREHHRKDRNARRTNRARHVFRAKEKPEAASSANAGYEPNREKEPIGCHIQQKASRH